MLRFTTINAITAAVFILFIVADYFLEVPIYAYVIVAVIWILITLMGSMFISWDYHITSLHRNITITDNNIAISFDDGPNLEYTPKVLSLLKQFNAKATFFCIGKHIEAEKDLFNRIISEGHTVGNHTYSHASNFGFFSSEKVISELKRTNKLVKEVSGHEMTMYRPAFGVTNPRIRKALATTHFISIGWSKRSFDTTNLSEEIIFKRITKNLKKGDIILLHDSSDKTIAVLERLLLFLQSNKMQSVTVDQLLEIEPYAN
ncbi:polysaccharide deacetylase family protein [Ulvibacter antarcticus]|uniref:Peptidoglycan/xylan/chitin deacetylase (PgdA/CDA1 family) n=1 Tax=Ulvibacter antarcticus TaxID=442714 RepID=A0A3L9YYS8_9FLAO|nr:polysaccharide deacetylase family protein [Ulvibacter antarcticus]RMA65723.1 peptidoglycan/xylan/chitin deacetylase (PgdA/CDA1 family) [Ulvibacter antarcticus]